MDEKRQIKRSFRIEVIFGGLAAIFCIVTLFSREWIEALTGWDPDNGNGALEWLIVGVLAVVAAILFIKARSNWEKIQTLPA